MYGMFMGILYLFLTFLFCFILVHLIKLAYLGFRSMKKPAEEVKEPPPKKAEPVYYIVEKKRTKKTFSNPKEIEFKK